MRYENDERCLDVRTIRLSKNAVSFPCHYRATDVTKNIEIFEDSDVFAFPIAIYASRIRISTKLNIQMHLISRSA